MTPQPILFGNAQESGEQELAGGSPLAMNVLVDGKGAVRRRPGIAAYDEAPSGAIDTTGIAGIHVTSGDVLLVVGENRHIYRVFDGLTSDLSADNTKPVELLGSRRPTFAENELVAIIAGGNKIQRVDLSTFVSSRLDASSTDAPPYASHVAANSSRFLANDLGSSSVAGQLRFSRTGLVDYDEWPARFFVTAENKPDPVVAIGESTNEVWVWGTQTTQLFVPDPSSVYAPSKSLRFGLAAPYSVVLADEQFGWFDPAHRFLLSDGRATNDLSKAIAGTLDRVTSSSDCFGYRIQTDQFDCLVWTFPTDGRTFCYQVDGGWSQWHGPGPSLFPVTAHFARTADNTDVVGLSTGRVCQLDSSATDDLGEPIVADVRTGFMARGTDARKWCNAVRLTMRRGATADGDDEPVALLSWRDDGGAFGDPVPIGLGTGEDREFTVELRSLGVYRRRQWRLVYSGSAEWVLAAAEEDLEVLES